MGGGRAAAVEWGDFLFVHPSVRPSIPPIWAIQPGLRPSQLCLKSEAWLAGWLGLRPGWLGLRPGLMALRGDGQTNGKSPHSKRVRCFFVIITFIIHPPLPMPVYPLYPPYFQSAAFELPFRQKKEEEKVAQKGKYGGWRRKRRGEICWAETYFI